MTHVCKRFTSGIVRDRSGGAGPVSALLGWTLAVAAVAAGYVGYGWRGVVLAGTVIVFWLLLQFGRSLRAVQAASRRPVGAVDSALMLHARLHPGMRLIEILKLTRSLGRKVADEPETFVWRDAEGSEVRVEFRAGRLSGSTFVRAPAAGAAATE
jgi:hypothetical protein